MDAKPEHLTIDQLNDCSRGTVIYVGPPNASRPFVRTWTGWRPATERGHARPGSDVHPSWQIAEAGATR